MDAGNGENKEADGMEYKELVQEDNEQEMDVDEGWQQTSDDTSDNNSLDRGLCCNQPQDMDASPGREILILPMSHIRALQERHPDLELRALAHMQSYLHKFFENSDLTFDNNTNTESVDKGNYDLPQFQQYREEKRNTDHNPVEEEVIHFKPNQMQTQQESNYSDDQKSQYLPGRKRTMEDQPEVDIEPKRKRDCNLEEAQLQKVDSSNLEPSVSLNKNDVSSSGSSAENSSFIDDSKSLVMASLNISDN